MNATQIAGMDQNCANTAIENPITCPLGPGPNPLLANVPYNPNPNALFLQYPASNTNTVGDGFDYVGYTFASPLPTSLNAYVAKLDYNLTRDGNHRLFVRGIMNNDRQAERNIATSITGDGGEEFPGQPAISARAR